MAFYETKFSLGDKVWGISHHRFDRIVRCKPCHNTGKVVIGDEELICPKCNGRSTHTQYAGEKWYISEFGATVGQVRIENTAYGHWMREEDPNPKFEYMIDSTGVGSGTIWKEERLFLSEEEAQAYCDRKNGLLPVDETESGKPIIGTYGNILSE